MIDKLPDSLPTLRCQTPLGEVLLAASPAGLAGAWFTHHQRDTPDVGNRTDTPDHPLLQQAASELQAYSGTTPLTTTRSARGYQAARCRSTASARRSSAMYGRR